MTIANDLFSQALALPAEQRKELAIRLWESLPQDDHLPVLESEYEAEIRRRVEEIDSGKAKMLSLEEVMSSVRRSAC
jgi:putative addiction module component (TIGR02574 family)